MIFVIVGFSVTLQGGLVPTLAHRLGIPRPGALDLNAGCAGFCYSLGLASDAIRAGDFWILPPSDRTDESIRARAESMLKRQNPTYLREVAG